MHVSTYLLLWDVGNDCENGDYMKLLLKSRFVGREFRPVIKGNSINIFLKSVPKLHYDPRSCYGLSNYANCWQNSNILLKNSFLMWLVISYYVIMIGGF